ncbi:unnamed protein product [Paramecium pentaurelia]|uniref:Uncharacterized protein n=1 Tax=Paramecium pentaurelia TaxID=43138 RepID=A0A8S1SNC3_9CILI|nr:unnamed protein product [Paramecium pentaurelia]
MTCFWMDLLDCCQQAQALIDYTWLFLLQYIAHFSFSANSSVLFILHKLAFKQGIKRQDPLQMDLSSKFYQGQSREATDIIKNIQKIQKRPYILWILEQNCIANIS